MNSKVICLLVIVATVLILYNTRRRIRKNEPIAGWSPQSIKNASHYIRPGSSILPKNFCETVGTILVMVHSHPSHIVARTIIRHTWYQDTNKLYFLLGRSKDDYYQQQTIREEQEMYQDIVIGNFFDSYNNLTLKSVVMLELAAHCGSSSLYLLKTDDDTLVNMQKLSQTLYDQSFPKDFLMGYLLCDERPNRDHTSERYMPYYMYPEETYPRYLSGGAYLMPMTVAQKLYQEALKTPLVHREDIFVTGICAQKAGIKLHHDSSFLKKHVLKNKCLLKDASAVFELTNAELKMYYPVMRTYSRPGVCLDVPNFSAFRWLFDLVFGVKDTPWGYRKTCK